MVSLLGCHAIFPVFQIMCWLGWQSILVSPMVAQILRFDACFSVTTQDSGQPCLTWIRLSPNFQFRVNPRGTYEVTPVESNQIHGGGWAILQDKWCGLSRKPMSSKKRHYSPWVKETLETQISDVRHSPRLAPGKDKPVVHGVLETIQKFIYELVSNLIKELLSILLSIIILIW